MTLLYIIVGIQVFFVLLSLVVALAEKRMVWPYGEPRPQPQYVDASGYAEGWIADATRAGLVFHGWASDLKGPRYRVSYALLSSAECFAIVGVGSILKMTLRGTWLYSRASNGEVFCSTDNQTCVEIDVARKWRCQLAPVQTFTALLERHREWIEAQHVTLQPFAPQNGIADLRQMREEHYHATERQRLIAFTDAAATHWRYTFWGAVKFAVLNHFIAFVRAVTAGRFPRTA